MIKKIDNPIRLNKLIFLIVSSFMLFFCCFTITYSDEKKTKEADEIKNNIFNLNDFALGRVSKEGIIYNRHGSKLGTVNEGGIIYNVSNIKIGKTESDGSVFNQIGTKLAVVNDKGDIFNRINYKVGYVKDISDINLIGAAARLVFFKGN